MTSTTKGSRSIAMQDKLLRILLIDDTPNVEEEVQNGLKKIGVPTRIN